MAQSAERAAVAVLIPLPIFYPPAARGDQGLEIPGEEFDKTAKEITEALQEGAVTWRFPAGDPKGFWWDKGFVDRDVLGLVEFDMEDTPTENRAWVRKDAKDVLLQRFRQKAIYVRFIWPMWRLEVDDEHISE